MAAEAAAGAPVRRMIIQKIVQENFKSYAGRVEIGPFHKSFTSVVGPNGSGKSNVIDSMLFVFGFRATKMRQAKLSELIHNSAKFPDVQQCSVAVHFVDILDLPGDAFEIVRGSELVVTRTATKTNKSQYYVNDKASNFTEVTDLLKARGIDLDHKRFLILQGEVEAISQMKPKAPSEHEDGLLEYLEDIIGTSALKVPIEEKAKDLEALSEDRGEKLNRVKIIEKEKDALEAKKNEAVEYLQQENELVRLKSTSTQVKIMEHQKQADKAQALLTEAKEKLEAMREGTKSLNKELKQLESAYNQNGKDYEDFTIQTIGAAVKKAKADFAAYERESIKLQENVKHLKDKDKKQRKALEKERAKAGEQRALATAAESDITKLTAATEKEAKDLAKAEQDLDAIRESLKGDTQEFQVELEAKQRELAPWQDKKAKVVAQMEVANAEVKLLEERLHATEKALKDIATQSDDVRKRLAEKTKQRDAAEANVARIKRDMAQTEAQIAALAKEEPLVTAAWKASREKAEEAKNATQASSSRTAVLKELIKQRSSGRIRGIHGRLGDLGMIDAKYDVAITTACPQLDNIVVDNAETGQKCIEFMRKNNLGRATFLLLDQLAAPVSTPASTPESVPRLYDLVKPKDPQYASAFYAALRETLVATDLQQANRVAFGPKRLRVVTVDGNLIETTGLMSGGGAKPQRGGMTASFKAADEDVTPQELAKLEAERDACEQAVRQVQEKHKAAVAQMAQLTTALGAADMELSKMAMDIRAFETQLEGLQEQAKQAKATHKPTDEDSKRLQTLQGTVLPPLQQELDKLNGSTKSLEEAIQALQARIQEVGGLRLRAAKAKVDGLNESMQTKNQQLIQAQVQLKTASKAVAKADEAVTALTEEVEGLVAQIAKVQAEVDEKATTAAAVEASYKKTEKLLGEKAEELEETKRRYEESKERLSAVRRAEVEAVSVVDDHTKTVDELTRKIEQGRRQLDSFKLQSIPLETEDPQPIRVLNAAEAAAVDLVSLSNSIAVLEGHPAAAPPSSDKLKSSKPNLSVIQQFVEMERDYLSKVADLNAITATRDQVKAAYDELRKRRLDTFMTGFTQITLKLKEMYQMITLGGNAELELVDSLDPFSEGIVFSVMPPKKSWKNIANLSGGEKTLSSLALVFALHHYKPTPLYVMDEIDAALDFRNVSIVANYIKERTRNAQFIIISLRNNMFELADRLVGIYKTDSCTKSITINPTQMAIVQ